MKFKTISYRKVFNLGNYSNEQIGVEIDLADGEDPIAVHAEAVKYVERAHQFQKQFPNYEKAQRILKEPDSYTGYEVKQAQQAIEVFENNFTEHLKHFFPVITELPATEEENPQITNW